MEQKSLYPKSISHTKKRKRGWAQAGRGSPDAAKIRANARSAGRIEILRANPPSANEWGANPRVRRCRARAPAVCARGILHDGGGTWWTCREIAIYLVRANGHRALVRARARAHAASLGRSRRNVVIVSVPPDILDYPTSTDMVVREGSNVTLRCAATGTPEPTVTWRREAGGTISLSNWQGTYLRILLLLLLLLLLCATIITTVLASLGADFLAHSM